MDGYSPDEARGSAGRDDLVWVNPSPAIANLNCVRCYTGTVLLEGTNLSEGRGTTTPLEVVGAPGLPVDALLAHMRRRRRILRGCYLRPCFFEPFFDKYTRKLCAGVQIHADFPATLRRVPAVPADLGAVQVAADVAARLRAVA